MMKWLKSLFASRKQKTYVLNNKHCPICQSFLIGWTESKWYYDENGQRVSHGISLHAICPQCQKLTVEDPFVPDNDDEPMQVTLYEVDWVKCPHCGWRFCVSDASYFANGRHSKCGQRLILATTGSKTPVFDASTEKAG